MKTFGVLFLFFWAVPFPMLIYYNSDDMTGSSTATGAFIWLGISVLFWIIFFYGLFRGLILRRSIAIRNLKNLMQNGDVITGKIIQSSLMPEEIPGVNKYQLLVELENFTGTTIHETVYINDAHPERHNYETGKSIKLRIDKSLVNKPYLQIDGAHYNPPDMRGLFVGVMIWLVILGVIAGYYLFSYQHESHGNGWHFMVWNHPLVLCPLILSIISLFGRNKKLTSNQLKHKYYGYKAEAQILNVTQTGLYVNQQPQVRFNITYTNQNGQVINANFTQIIDLLQVGMTQQKTIEIFYLSNEPQNICLAKDIELPV